MDSELVESDALLDVVEAVSVVDPSEVVPS
jgi:hypothetical protein